MKKLGIILLVLFAALPVRAQVIDMTINYDGRYCFVVEVAPNHTVTVSDEGDLIGFRATGEVIQNDPRFTTNGQVSRVAGLNYLYGTSHTRGGIKSRLGKVGNTTFRYITVNVNSQPRSRLSEVGDFKMEYYQQGSEPEKIGKIKNINGTVFDYYTIEAARNEGANASRKAGLLRKIDNYQFDYTIWGSPNQVNQRNNSSWNNNQNNNTNGRNNYGNQNNSYGSQNNYENPQNYGNPNRYDVNRNDIVDYHVPFGTKSEATLRGEREVFIDELDIIITIVERFNFPKNIFTNN